MVIADATREKGQYYVPDTERSSYPLIYLVDNELQLMLILKRDLNESDGNNSTQEFITDKLQSLLKKVSNGNLSPREMEILENAALGRSNKQIADILYVSESTIKHHLFRIMNKIHARDRTHAVALALCNGWLNIENISEKLNETTCKELTEERTNEGESVFKDKIVNVLNKKLW